tara:strand:- start:2785 stop:3354 length:570 start_codon:yes stop_codon:yes gene_type:complete
MKFKGKEYTEVKDRLIAFADEFPESTIESKLISVNQIVDTPTGETCNEYVVQAIVRPNPMQQPEWYYMGLAAERDNTGFVNKTSALENCETSAVGRALAFAGFGGDFAIASKEEVENAKAKQKAINPTIKSLEAMDKAARLATEAGELPEEDHLRYKQKRQAGFFDTKLKVSQSTEYFESLIPKQKEAK